MDTDRNLLFGVLALQSDLIDAQQFVEVCTVWSARKQQPLADILLERGWIQAADKGHVDYLLERKLQKHGGDARASLANARADVKRSLAAVPDDEIQRSLAESADHGHAGATLDHTPPLLADRYTLTRLHATGGIGRVWVARDRELDRHVALKELRPERANQRTLWARFVQEARVTGQLEHPGIVPVYELGRHADTQQPYYTMRFVKGRTLSEAARSHHRERQAGLADALEFPVLLNAFVMVANTIAYVHSRGILHRDLKGQNVVLGDFGEVVVLDWGLAKLIDQPDDAATDVQHPPGAADLTMQGQAVGTPAFMAPEQAAGERDRIDRRTDVYGLGAILYEILTGQPPFRGVDTVDVLRKVREEDPTPPSATWPEAPPGLQAVCLRALAKDPAARFASAGDLAKEVQSWQELERTKAEEALRNSEALYHSLVETLPLQVWRKDLQGHFTFVNKGFCEYFGKTLSEVVGRTDFDLVPADLAEKYQRDDRQVLETGTTHKIAEEHVTVAGHKLYVQAVKTPLRDSHGQLIGTQGIFWDITDRKHAEEDRDRFFAQSLDMLCLAKFDGHFERINPAFERTLGFPLEEILARPFSDFIHPDDWQRTVAVMDHLGEGKDTIFFENRWRCRDGAYIWLSWMATAFFDRQPPIIFASARDITAQKQAQEALRESEERYRSVIAAMQPGIIIWDADGNYRSSNASAERILGLSAEQLQNRSTTDARWQPITEDGSPFPPDRYPTVVTLRTGQPVVDCVLGVCKPDGALTWVSVNCQPLFQADGTTLAGVVASFVDITDRKRIQAELQATKAELAGAPNRKR